jgi:hypothetical protein
MWIYLLSCILGPRSHGNYIIEQPSYYLCLHRLEFKNRHILVVHRHNKSVRLSSRNIWDSRNMPKTNDVTYQITAQLGIRLIVDYPESPRKSQLVLISINIFSLTWHRKFFTLSHIWFIPNFKFEVQVWHHLPWLLIMSILDITL